jgi:methylated-DNA-[protein]-cysteine S-methyltransferase
MASMTETRHHRPVTRSGSEPLRWVRVPSPIGELLLVGHGGALTGLYVAEHEKCPAVTTGGIEDDGPFDEARRQLDEYFAGTRTTFDLEIDLRGTDFQVRVWQALLDIPFGETITYGEQARRIGSPTAYRAVGSANGRNPVSLIVPCHRVVGAAGALTGYGWGTDRKAWLLAHEGAGRPSEAPSLF